MRIPACEQHSYSDSSGDDKDLNQNGSSDENPNSDDNSFRSPVSTDSIDSASGSGANRVEEADSGNYSANSDSDVIRSDVDSCPLESSDSSESTLSIDDDEEEATDESDNSPLLSRPPSECSSDEALVRFGFNGTTSETGDSYSYPVDIVGQPLAKTKYCDLCSQYQDQTWYHCPICHRHGYDVCHTATRTAVGA